MEAVKQVPALLVLVYLVNSGAKNLKSVGDHFVDTLSSIGESCHAFSSEREDKLLMAMANAEKMQDRAIDALQENSRVTGKMEALLQRHLNGTSGSERIPRS